jgi:hypothetical protein
VLTEKASNLVVTIREKVKSICKHLFPHPLQLLDHCAKHGWVKWATVPRHVAMSIVHFPLHLIGKLLEQASCLGTLLPAVCN